jgi:peptidyl-prolyl cis-trans isomerase SurA
VIGEEVGSHLSITKEEAQKFYDEHKADLEQPESIRLSEILVAPKLAADAAPASPNPADANNPSAPAAQNPVANPAAKQAAEEAALAAAKAKADDLLEQIHKGASFDDIAKKSSDGPSASQGGELGVFKRGALAKELEDKTFAMKTGDVSDVIRTKQGYVILKVTEHQKAGIPEMKDVAPKIQDALYYEKLQPALRAYLTKLREEAYIKIASGFLDSGASPNQTQPIETTTAKEGDAKNLKGKRKKKLGIL